MKNNQSQNPNLTKWLTPLSWALSGLSQVRVWAYRNHWASSLTLKTPVISLGNLTVGGTGKTPLVDLVISYFESKDKTVGVVSRAYKASATKPTRVDIQNPEGAKVYGDEPLWLATVHPKASVYVGPEKWRTARVLETLERVNVIVIDDGFQHLQLNRQLNLLLLDLSQPISHYQVLPLGRAREEISQFFRADFVLFTKAQKRNSQTEKWFEKQGVYEKPFAIVRQELAGVRSMNIPNQSNAIDPTGVPAGLVLSGSRWLVVCGLADPESFMDLLKSQYPKRQFESCFFADHHQYTIKDVMEIEKRRVQKNCQMVVVTEKDEIKLRGFSKCSTWGVAPLKIKFDQGESEFYECLHEVLG